MSILLDKSGELLDDVVVLDQQDVADFNETNILPQSDSFIAIERNWLSPTQYADDGSEYKKHLSSHLKGTGQWAIDSPIFQEWRDSQHHGILWIRGIPGSGKSVHAANLIQHLAHNGYPVLYFFFRHTIEANHRPEAALRDWLAQVLPFSPPLQLAMKDLVSTPLESLKLSDLTQLLKSALEHMPKAYCVVDALDEMDQTALKPFLQRLDELGHWRPSEIKFIITSRPVAIIERIVRNIKLLDVRLDRELVEPDITIYLWHRLGQSRIPSEGHSGVVEYILKQADGLFLYAKLAMDAISHLETAAEAQRTLQSLPADLTVMYSNLLQEHLQRTGILPELQILILQCVTHAIRPLRLLELSDCITVTQPQYGTDPGKLKSLVRSACGPLLEILPDETVRVVHHSLTEYLLGIIKPGEGNVAPFIVLEAGLTHGLLAQLCLTYLQSGGLGQLKVTKTGWFSRGNERIDNEVYTPFTKYAAGNWHRHIKKAVAFGHNIPGIHEFLHRILVEGGPEDVEKLGIYARLAVKHDGKGRGKARPKAAALKLAISLGLNSFVCYLLDRHGNGIIGYDKDLDYTPLIFAVRAGNRDVVESLIRHGANLNEHDTHGVTPLHAAVGYYTNDRKGNPEMADILLKAGADIEQDRGNDEHVMDITIGGRSKYTACKAAFQHGNPEMAAVFMPYIHGTKNIGRVLSWATDCSSQPNADVIALILKHPDLDINAKMENGTPLYRACSARDSTLIRMYLAAGADPNVVHPSGRRYGDDSKVDESLGTNVLHALASRYEELSSPTGYKKSPEETKACFKLVLEAGAKVNQIDATKSTPLHRARDKVAARCLIEAGADLHAENTSGEKPIHLINDLEILEELLQVFDINARSSKSGQTLLMRTLDDSKYGFSSRVNKSDRFEKALRLCELGADASIVDDQGRGALYYSIMMDDLEQPERRVLWERLKAAGADANVPDKEGDTPSHKVGNKYNRFKFDDHVSTFLYIFKPDLEIKDKCGRTPLFKMLDDWDDYQYDQGSPLLVIELLGKYGARFDMTDMRGRTLLHAVAPHCRKDAAPMQFLIEQGIDPSVKDTDGNTVWHVAAPKFHRWGTSSEVFKAMQDLGADMSLTNNAGQTPLHVLSKYAHPDHKEIDWDKKTDLSLLEYIIRHDPSQIQAKDENGITPLHIALTFAPYLVRRFLKKGARPEITTSEGLNAFHITARSRQSNIIGFLLSWMESNGGKEELHRALNAKDKLGRAPLYYACLSGRIESVQMLVDAGASVDSESYEGSAWNGCADFQDEQRWEHWNGWNDNNQHNYPDMALAGGVLIADKLRPRRQPIPPSTYLTHFDFAHERIDEIVELLVLRGATSGRKFVDEAIKSAAEKQFDYTVACLMLARESLGIEDTLECQEKVEECLERWNDSAKNRRCGNPAHSVMGSCPSHSQKLSSRDLMHRKHFRAAEKSMLANPENQLFPNPNRQRSTLEDLANGGFVKILDAVLTPEVMSRLEAFKAPVSESLRLGIDAEIAKENAQEERKKKQTGRYSGEIFGQLLHAACQAESPNMNVLRFLVETKDIDINSRYKDNNNNWSSDKRSTVLHALVRGGHLQWWHLNQALPYLLSRGADVNALDGSEMTPLTACLDKISESWFSMEIVELLLQAGADPNCVDKCGRSSLSRAAHDKVVYDLLMKYGAKVNQSALVAAIGSQSVDLLKLLLSHDGVDANARKVGREEPAKTSDDGKYHWNERHDPNDKDELYPIDFLLCRVVRDKNTEEFSQMLDLLLEHGAQLHAKYTRTTVIHRLMQNKTENPNTSYSGEHDYLKRCLEHPSLDIEVTDGDGLTLLLLACKIGKKWAVRTLLDRGANVRAKDNKNQNALNHFLRSRSNCGSKQCKHRDSSLCLRKELVQRMISLAPELLSDVDDEGRTVLHCALQRVALVGGDIDALLSAQADMHSVIPATGDTPLHLLFEGAWDVDVSDEGAGVVTGERKNLLNRFLAAGADINVRNRAGETPAFHFFRKGSVKIVKPESDSEKSNDSCDTFPFGASRLTYEREHEKRKVRGALAVKHEPKVWTLFEQLGVDWSVTSNSRKTLLHVVAADTAREDDSYKYRPGRRVARFQFLMEKGIDVLAEDEKHQTALDIAAALGVEDILDMFKSKS